MQGVDALSRRQERARRSTAGRDALSRPAEHVAAMHLNEPIAALGTRHRGGALADAEFAAIYFLTWQIALYGARFASRRFKQDARPDARQWLDALSENHGAALRALLTHYLERYQFTGVIPSVGFALVRWLRGEWCLRLCAHIPTPIDVLRMQVGGVRPVTVILDTQKLLRPVLTKANAFVFMTHDLEHAYKFFHDARAHAMQRRLFAALERLCAAGRFARYAMDAEFAARFDYLISDMNTHPMHSLQYLRAILVEHHLRAAGALSTDPLTPQARIDVDALLAAIGAAAQFDDVAQHAMHELAAGRADTSVARAIECGFGACFV